MATTGLLVRVLGGLGEDSSNQEGEVGGEGCLHVESSQEHSAASVMKEAKRHSLEQKKAKTG